MKCFIEENAIYQIDVSASIWATDELNNIFHSAKTELSDVDWVIETPESLLLVEYKNANFAGAANPGAFQPGSDKLISKVVRKYYDSCFYLDAIGKNKPKIYIYILEFPLGDKVTRKLIRERLTLKLPFALQRTEGVRKELIRRVEVLSIEEWNSHSVYGSYKIKKIEDT